MLMGGKCDAPEESKQHAGGLQPARGQENEGVHVVAGDIPGPIQRVVSVREHGGFRRQRRPVRVLEQVWEDEEASPAFAPSMQLGPIE